MQRFPLLAVIAVASVAVPSFAEETPPTRIVEDVSSILGITDLSEQSGQVSGRLVNRSGDTLKEVRIVVSHGFLWNDERHPGADGPSWATIVTLPQPVPPNGTVPFTVTTGAAPTRNDGRFTLEASVLGFVAWSQTRTQPTVVKSQAAGF